MPNPQNLAPIRTHEEAVARGRAGGLKGGLSKSPRKKWSALKYCSPQKCPYSGGCPFMTASLASPDKHCALKAKKVTAFGKEAAIQQDVIESFFSLFEEGGAGLLKEALAGTYKIRLRSVNATTEELHDYVHTIIDVKKAFYPEKEGMGDTNINVNFEQPLW